MSDNLAFTYEALPGRVVFGAGSRRSLADEARRLGSERVLVVAHDAEDEIAAEAIGVLGDLVAGRFTDVAQHVPVTKAAEAVALTREVGADTVLTIGGGSATGFGKVIALEVDVRQMALPTTYAGSEMTPIWGMTDGDHKRTGTDQRIKPDVVVYDPELTLTLPPRIAGPSGMNALAHSIEALYGPGANPVLSVLALESIRALSAGLPVVTSKPDDLGGRTGVLYGAYLAGIALASGGTALHHKTCHVLGGMFNLNHGDMNAVVLGHALAYTAPAIGDVVARIATALDVEPDGAAAALADLAAAIGAPTSLEAIGMPESGIGPAAERIVVAAAANPRPPDLDSITQMLDDAWHGRRPAS